MYRLTFVFFALAIAGCQLAKKSKATAGTYKGMKSVVENLVPVGTPVDEAVKVMQESGFSVHRNTSGQGSGNSEPAAPLNVIDPPARQITCYRSKLRTGPFPEQWQVGLEIDENGEVVKISIGVLSDAL